MLTMCMPYGMWCVLIYNNNKIREEKKFKNRKFIAPVWCYIFTNERGTVFFLVHDTFSSEWNIIIIYLHSMVFFVSIWMTFTPAFNLINILKDVLYLIFTQILLSNVSKRCKMQEGTFFYRSWNLIQGTWHVGF